MSAAASTTVIPTADVKVNTNTVVYSTDAVSGEVKQLKICCACPTTRIPRDECVVTKGEDECADVITAHKTCLRGLGFKI